MSTSKDNTRADLRVNRQDPSTWLKPGQSLIGADGRDWAWCYVLYAEVPGFPAYCVGTNGQVWSRIKKQTGGRGNRYGPFRVVLGKLWRRLRPVKRRPHGYLFVGLSDMDPEGDRPQRSVHSLVLEAHVGPAPPGCHCRHLDGTRDNNRLRNLRYGTVAENMADKLRHGTEQRGERVGTSRLEGEDVLEIRRLHAAGMTQWDMAHRFGVHQATISRIVLRKSWAHI